MATYPTTLPVHVSSRRIIRDGRRATISDSGKSYVANLYSSDRSDFDIVHIALTTSELSTLTTFYNTNAVSTFDFVWPQTGTTYTSLKFGENAIQITPNPHLPSANDVRVRMVSS